MYATVKVALLLFVLATHLDHVLSISRSNIIPLTHNSPTATSFRVLADGELAIVETLTRYKRDITDIPLTASGNSVIITCQITLGPSRNPFTVLLDTGSPLLALPTPGCSCDSDAPNAPYSKATNALSCSDSRCNSCCDKNVCNKTQCGFSLVYADGTSLNGSVYQDTIELGGLKSNIQLFGGITQMSSGFVAPYADGILGFSQDGSISCLPTCMPPVFSVFVKNGLVPNSFGVYLDTSGSGVLTLGGVDESIVNEQFHYTPLQQLTNHYQISLESLQVEGESVVSSLTVLLDTGTTYILLPRSAYQKIVSHFQTHYCNLTGVCSQANIFNGNCLIDVRKVEAFPDLTFQFNGLQVTVKPTSYFLQTALRGPQKGYCFGILPWRVDYAIFGYTFMRGHYIHYDMVNRRIGFAGANATLDLFSISSSASSPSSSLPPTMLLFIVVLLVSLPCPL